MENNKFRFKDLGGLAKETFKEWNDDDAFTQAAAVSYYAIFSLPAILILIINIAGLIFGKQEIQGKIIGTLGKTMGQDTANQIQTMIQNSSNHSNSTIMIIIGIGVLLVSATGLFVQLQKALNKMWDVKVKEDAGIKELFIDRTLSFGLILAIGFLLMISLVITALLSALSSWIMTKLPDFTLYVFYALNFVLSFGVITLLFALLFKFLPDVHIEFKSVWVGAIVTAFLFMLGKFGISFYFGKANPGSAYGAAGSLILILLWVYYSCLLLFFGAEFTQSYAKKYGHKIMPGKNAIKVDPCMPLEPHGYRTSH